MENIIKWKDRELVVHNMSGSQMNSGRLSKFWVKDINTNQIFLVKGTGWFGYEPYCEKIAYIIGKNLGIDVLEYDIIESNLFKGVVPISRNCKHFSICEKIDKYGYSITTVAEIKRARNALLKDGDTPITNREVMYELLSHKYIDTMLLFDAIIGNTDRHYGNIHILRGLDGEMVGAPILDNGASLLATYYSFQILMLGHKIGKLLNKSYTLEKSHDLQMNHVETIAGLNINIPDITIKIIEEIDPVLEFLPKWRAKAIKKYIVFRLHKYLGMLKKPARKNKRR